MNYKSDPSKPDGGQAFPTGISVDHAGDIYHGNDGMTLRDWFAGQQMIRIALGWPNDETMKEIAARCYAMADAFLAERAKP